MILIKIKAEASAIRKTKVINLKEEEVTFEVKRMVNIVESANDSESCKECNRKRTQQRVRQMVNISDRKTW